MIGVVLLYEVLYHVQIKLLVWKEKSRWFRVKVAAPIMTWYTSSANLDYRYRRRRHKFPSLLFWWHMFCLSFISFGFEYCTSFSDSIVYQNAWSANSETAGVIQLTLEILCARLKDYYHGFTLYMFSANVTCSQSGSHIVWHIFCQFSHRLKDNYHGLRLLHPCVAST